MPMNKQIVIDAKVFRAWLTKNNKRPEDFASDSGLGIGTIWRCLQEKGIRQGTLTVVSQKTGIPESVLLRKSSKARKIA
jgi:hypothetical protein